MQIDSLTLMIPDALSSAVAGLLLVGAWLLFSKAAPALLWWAAANGIGAIGLAVLTVGLGLQIPLLIMAGVALTTATPALVWGGVRHFNHRRAPLVLLGAGVVIWLAIGTVPFDVDHQKWSTLATFVSWCVYLPAAIWGLWTSREEKLVARWPLMAFLALHATMFLGAGYEILFGLFDLNAPPRLGTFFGTVHFESVLFSMGTAVFMVLLCKERSELSYIKAAKIDALTGSVNHGAWLDSAARLLDRSRHEGSPFSLIIFDLDRFKAVNDTYGHQAGDRVLRAVADTVRGALRPNDLFGRYGGEEFTVVLPGATIETAYVIAERVRHTFAGSHRFLDGQPLNATVSAGVASASPLSTLEAVIEAADQAMYMAKAAGRNRVERSGGDHPADSDNIIRVA
jgi:diguanylate cyclase (GGDEF)-like protein